jgi:chlorophyllide a reductase subunit Y
MKAFFGDVGEGENAGVWQGVPVDRPEFRALTRRRVQKAAAQRKSEEMG